MKKIISYVAAFIFLLTLIVPISLAAELPPPGPPTPPTPPAPAGAGTFWRTDGMNEYLSTTDEPGVKKYGFGYGEQGWGYGYGYGYGVDNQAGYYIGGEAYEDPTTVTFIGSGQARVDGGDPTNTTKVTMTDTVSFEPGAGIMVVLPNGLEITKSGGGAFDATAIAAGAGSASGGDIGANINLDGSVDFGLGLSIKLIFSIPVKVVIPVPGIANGRTVNIAVKHAGEDFNSNSLSTSPTATCSAEGVANPTANVATVTGGAITVYTCAASQFAAYSGTGGTSGTTVGGGGGAGGGGGSSVSMVDETSNTATSSISSAFKTVVETDRTYSRPIQIAEELITMEGSNKMAVLTGVNGKITHKPNSKSTIYVVIPASTSVTASGDWDGLILPPILRDSSLISANGDTIEGSDMKLKRGDVNYVVKAGSKLSPLTFSNPVMLVVPTALPEGTEVEVFYSNDAKTWTVGGTVVVADGKIMYEGTHLSYFAFSSDISNEDLAAMADSFMDIKGHWGESYIKRLANMGVVKGRAQGQFAPNMDITRAELTKIAIVAFDIEVPADVTEKPFSDVEIDAWYAPYIQAAKDAGIVEGMGDGTFAPNKPISRVEALKILIEASGHEAGDADEADFDDVMKGAWYMKYVNYAKMKGVVGGYGDGSFRPGNSITRAEVSKITIKVLDLQ